jgi:hypothetical protein
LGESAGPSAYARISLYPPLQIWFNHVLKGKAKELPVPRFPKAPTFFGYGAKKRAFFHSEGFLARLEKVRIVSDKS